MRSCTTRVLAPYRGIVANRRVIRTVRVTKVLAASADVPQNGMTERLANDPSRNPNLDRPEMTPPVADSTRSRGDGRLEAEIDNGRSLRAISYPPRLGFRSNFALASAFGLALAVPFGLGIARRLPASAAVAISTVGALIVAQIRAMIVDRVYNAMLWPYNDDRLVSKRNSMFVAVGGADVHVESMGGGGGGGRASEDIEIAVDRGQRDEEVGIDNQDLKPAVLCVHGFGASTRSFRRAGPKIGDALALATATMKTQSDAVRAFDMPGFGLTSRPKDLRAYGIGNAAKIGAALIDAIRAGRLDHAEDATATAESTTRARSRGVVLVGHSLGANVVVRAAKNACENAAERATDIVPAIVLIAPAITAAIQRSEATTAGFIGALGRRARRCLNAVRETLARIFTLTIVATILGPARRIVFSILRRMVNSDDFWRRGLRLAFLDEAEVDDATIEAYASPRNVKGWDRGMLMFVASQLLAFVLKPRGSTDDGAIEWAVKAGIPILVVHGDADQIVPLKNSAELVARCKGGARDDRREGSAAERASSGETQSLMEDGGTRPELSVLRCGHNPHEELPDDFVDVFLSFLRRSGIRV